MASLTAHLLETGDHGRLGFHRSCPVCREQRLFGNLPSEPVVSRRAQAALATGVLAFTSGAPVALAQEPDRRGEGQAAPEQPVAGDPDAPDFDPGGDTELPFEVAPTPAPNADGGIDDGPVETEPSQDFDAGEAPVSAPEAPAAEPEGPAEDLPVPPAESLVPPDREATVEADGAVPPADGGLPAPTASPAPPSEAAPVAERPNRDRPAQSRLRAPGGSPADDADRLAQRDPADGVTQPVTADVAPIADDSPAYASEPVGNPPRSGTARFYIVQPGDSLWVIAKRLLGRGASPAEIGREVARLWAMNEDRIGTGKPDLLLVGTKLRLR